MNSTDQLKMSDFEVIRELGSGSFARVQLIKRKADKKYYALKSMFLADAKPKIKDAALNEIRLLASIHLPNVISYKGSFYLPEVQSLCIVMEYADGGDLEGKINQRNRLSRPSGFEQRFIWKTIYYLLKGLKGLHEHNIIHRDLKSANIFFVDDVAKIGDLNISKITENGFASTQTGTPYYTSPQIWKGVEYDNKCDIWSLGCLIYEMCNLEPPFKARDFPGLFRAVTTGTYEQISTKYTKNVAQFVANCLKLDPNERPSAASLLKKPYFAEFQLLNIDKANLKQKKVEFDIMEPIQCPKQMDFLNERLPRSKFDVAGKKTVCFVEHGSEAISPLRSKLRQFKSEKMLRINEQMSVSKTGQKQLLQRAPKFLIKNNKYANLESLPSKEGVKIELKFGPSSECKSMKNIVLKQNKRVVFK